MLVLSPLAVALERSSDRVQHVLIAKRLGEKIDSAGFHGLHRHRDVAVPGHEYDRSMDVRLGELGLEVESGEPRQSDIEQEAGCHIGKLAAQQGRGRTERLDLEAGRSKQAAQRLAHGFIVVNDEYHGFFGNSGWASGTLFPGIVSGQAVLPGEDKAFPSSIEVQESMSATKKSHGCCVCWRGVKDRVNFTPAPNHPKYESVV